MNVPKRKRSVIAFTDALCRLVGDTPLKKLTVTGICEEAGYTSMAFYSSFENKYDFVHSIIDYEARVFAGCLHDRLEQLERFSPAKAGPELHRSYVTDFLEHVAENRELYRCILNDRFVPDGITLLSKRITHHVSEYLVLQAAESAEMQNFTSFVLEITWAQMLMVVRYWLAKMPEMDPQSVAALYCGRFLFRNEISLERDPENGTFCANLRMPDQA